MIFKILNKNIHYRYGHFQEKRKNLEIHPRYDFSEFPSKMVILGSKSKLQFLEIQRLNFRPRSDTKAFTENLNAKRVSSCSPGQIRRTVRIEKVMPTRLTVRII